MTEHRFNPDCAVPPGATLKETIDNLGMSQRELSIRMGECAAELLRISERMNHD